MSWNFLDWIWASIFSVIFIVFALGIIVSGCTTTGDGWHQDEVDWIIQNG